eukprot:Filipodium_phascolosomae@DN2430_c0_g1_i1.p1
MSQTTKAVVTAVGAGVLHVILGPDHLSAIATVSVCKGKAAFCDGVRWGIGHSSGLCLVGLIFWLVSRVLTSESGPYGGFFTLAANYLVGFFMLAFGFYFLWKSRRLFAHISPCEETTETGETPADLAPNIPDGSTDDSPERLELSTAEEEFPKESTGLVSDPADESPSAEDENRSICCKRSAAFIVGVIHGVGGPGGILGLLPATHFSTSWLAAVYLGVFLLSSTLMMGLVGAAWGEITARLADNVSSAGNSYIMPILYVFSSCLSILVGIVWLILCATGNIGLLLGE